MNSARRHTLAFFGAGPKASESKKKLSVKHNCHLVIEHCNSGSIRGHKAFVL